MSDTYFHWEQLRCERCMKIVAYGGNHCTDEEAKTMFDLFEVIHCAECTAEYMTDLDRVNEELREKVGEEPE